jgi:hypothetical protein
MAVASTSTSTSPSAPRYFPPMTSLSFTGSVMSISSVPLLRSSATRRIVTTGITSTLRPSGANSNSRPSVARSTCQNPPRQKKKRKPTAMKLRQITT